MEKTVIVSLFGVTTYSISRESRVHSHNVCKFLKVSVHFRLNISQQCGKPAKLYHIYNSDMYIMMGEVVLVSPP